ncbi:MAG: hypothetical protein JWP31_1478, partial [Aeromicrobium sp.]|nr:hypothetical protein [Aeromicrobium sp.]
MADTAGERDAGRMAFRPALRPGALLLRRDATHLQVGTSPGIVLLDRPGLLRLLRLLDGSRDVTRLRDLVRERVPELTDEVGRLLTELRALGVVVDASAHAVAPRRDAYEVGFEHGRGSADLVATTTSILGAAGVLRVASTEPDLLVVTSCGEPPRDVFERAGLLRLDHLPVVIDEDQVRIGPLVRPGRTPCMSCHDLHRTDWDPAWPALVHQLGSSVVGRLPSVDPLTARA